MSEHWADWTRGNEFTLGVEEETMLLNPHDWSLAQQIDRVLPALSEELSAHVTPETHRSALELSTGVHPTVAGMATELMQLRSMLQRELRPLGLSCASAATHPFTVWQETVVSTGPRYDLVYGSMRELARREPTFALHVHVGVDDPEDAIRLTNRMRGHLPLLLALSVNSPFWQGRDTGLGSARTPLFQAFPRVGIPRVFRDYADWVEAVDLLIRCDAFPEPTFLWWDVRPQPRFGTVEVRILDAQTTVAETAALVALVQSLARLEIAGGLRLGAAREHSGGAGREPLHRGTGWHGGDADRPRPRTTGAGPRAAGIPPGRRDPARAGAGLRRRAGADLGHGRAHRGAAAAGVRAPGQRAARAGRRAGRCVLPRGVC